MSISAFRTQLAVVEERLPTDPHGAGMEALKIFEDLLYELARAHGWRGKHGGMNEYMDFLRKRRVLREEIIAQGRRYADIRNCLAHRSGLLISPALAQEIVEFVKQVCKEQGNIAGDVMTRNPRVAHPNMPVEDARNIMLKYNIGHLPVLENGRYVGLLTGRDLLAMLGTQRDMRRLRVADVMNADKREVVRFAREETPLEDVLRMLEGRYVQAVLITDTGTPEGKMLGIITTSDLLPHI